MEKGSGIGHSKFTKENSGFKPQNSKPGQGLKSPQPAISTTSQEATLKAQRDILILEQERLDKQEVEYQQKLAEVNAQADRNEAEKLKIANAQMEPNPHGLMSPPDKNIAPPVNNNGQTIIPGTDPLLPVNLHRQLHSSEPDRHVRFGGVTTGDSTGANNLYTPSKYVLTQEELDEMIQDSNRRNQIIIDDHNNSMESNIRNQMSARKHKPLPLSAGYASSPFNPYASIPPVKSGGFDPYSEYDNSIGLPKNPLSKQLELLMGLNHFPNEPRDAHHAIPTVPDQLYAFNGDRTFSGRISIGSAAVANEILENLKAASETSNSSKYLPDKTFEWIMDTKNTTGFRQYLPINPPENDDSGQRISDIRQTMIDVLRQNYPGGVSTFLSQTHIVRIKKSDQPRFTTKGDLLGWLTKTNEHYQSVFPNIFKCLYQTDPINDPNTQTKFLDYLEEGKAKSNNKEALEYLEREITLFNLSSTLLASQIQELVKEEYQLLSDLVPILYNSKEIRKNGPALFYVMKNTLKESAAQIGTSYDVKIRNLTMGYNGYPEWIEYVKQAVRLRQNLQQYNLFINDHVLHARFLTEFYRVMTENMGNRAVTDNMYQQLFHQSLHPTWDHILTLVSSTERQLYVSTCTKRILEEERKLSEQSNMVYNASIPALSETSVLLKKWADGSDCGIHGKHHKNTECRKQNTIRFNRKLTLSAKAALLENLKEQVKRDVAAYHKTKESNPVTHKVKFQKNSDPEPPAKKARTRTKTAAAVSAVTEAVVNTTYEVASEDIPDPATTFKRLRVSEEYRKPYTGPTTGDYSDDDSDSNSEDPIRFDQDQRVTEFQLKQGARKRDRELPRHTNVSPTQRMCNTDTPYLYNTVDSTGTFIPGALGEPTPSQREDIEDRRLIQLTEDAMYARYVKD